MWPKPTHAPADSEAVKSGLLKPYKSAADCINFDLPCPSIFERSKPLVPNTLRRIARGLDKFVIKEAKPFLVHIGNGERKGQLPRIYDINNPINTVVSSCKQYLGMPFFSTLKFQNNPNATTEPLTTVTSVNCHSLIFPALIQYHSETAKADVRGQMIDKPLLTTDMSNRYGLFSPFLTQYYSGADHANSVRNPLQTVTVQPRHFLCKSFLTVLRKNMDSKSISEPIPTITARANHFTTVRVYIKKYTAGQSLGYWEKVRELLNTYTEWDFKADEILIFLIDGVEHYISDIGMRMLQPDELYKAQGFPDDYIIDRDYTGKEYPKTKQVARCGNAVPPPFAAALVRANLPEWCSSEIQSMKQLNERIAV